MTKEIDQAQANLAVAIKVQRENFSPGLWKELYTQTAKEYKIAYDCYRKEGFTVCEALRLTTKCFD